MKKVVAVIGLGVLSVGLLSGCGKPDPIIFEGKTMSVEQVGEILEDRLEAENGIELEVDVYHESDD
jgi:hypothetical protein